MSGFNRQFDQERELSDVKATKRSLDFADCTSAVYALSPWERTVNVKTSNTGAWTLRMPSVAKCAGLIFNIFMTARDTNDVTITDCLDDTTKGALGGADITLNLADDTVTLYSDGERWVLLASTGV